MLLYGVDELTIKIYNLRNIESINIYDMVLPKSNKMEVVPAIIVRYDGGKSLNLCSRDKGFDLLARKVTQVYNDEKNNILEDSLTDPFKLRTTIKIDDRTKQILEQGTLLEVNNLYEFYKDKTSYDMSLMFQIDEVNMIVNLIKYHVRDFFCHTDLDIAFDEELSGYRDNYLLGGKVNGISKYFPFIFDKLSDNTYKVTIGQIIENTPIDLNIEFSKDNINVNIDIDKLDVSCDYKYLITNEVIKRIETIKKNNIVTHYRNEDLNQINHEFKNIVNFDSEGNLKWFYLPWNAYYGIDNTINELSPSEKIIKIYSMYLDVHDREYFKKEFYSRSYKRNNTVTIFGESVTLDELVKDTRCICLNQKEGTYLIETSFLDVSNCNGYYIDNLGGKKFYHLYKSSKINEFSPDDLVSIGKENGFLDSGDLLNDSLTLKLIRGE